jgi:hypothetical protein
MEHADVAQWPYSTTAWARLRLAKLAASPLCEACNLRGDLTEANTVDHVIAIAKGGDAFPALEGLMALCASCHGQKTAAMDRQGGKGVRFKGAALDGLPVDPLHPFFSDSLGGIPPSRTATLASRTDVLPPQILSSDFDPTSERG